MIRILRKWWLDRQAGGTRYARPFRFSVRCVAGFHEWEYSETGYSRTCDRCKAVESGTLLL